MNAVSNVEVVTSTLTAFMIGVLVLAAVAAVAALIIVIWRDR